MARFLTWDARGQHRLEHTVRQIMLDSNVYDVVAADAGLKVDIEALQAQGKLEAIQTHIQKGELSLIPMGRQIGQAEAVKGKPVRTAVTVLGKGFFGHSRLGSAAASALYRKMRTGNPKHIEDGMIAATVLFEKATLVTEDIRFAKRMAEQAPGVEVLNGDGLRALVAQLKAV